MYEFAKHMQDAACPTLARLGVQTPNNASLQRASLSPPPPASITVSSLFIVKPILQRDFLSFCRKSRAMSGTPYSAVSPPHIAIETKRFVKLKHGTCDIR